MNISIIVAMDLQRVIGSQRKLPWQGQLPDDLKRFKQLTWGHPVIMGRRTFESIGQRLPGRTNIVVSSSLIEPSAENVEIARSIQEALKIAERSNGSNEIFVIGGAELYRAALPLANRMYITHIEGVFNGNAYFPEFDEDEWMRATSQTFKKDERNKYSCKTVTYIRIKNSVRKVVDPTYAERDPAYKQVIDQIASEGICPFCKDSFKYHPRQILKTEGNWFITQSMTPYENTLYHFIILDISTHRESVNELEPSDLTAILNLINWAVNEYKLKGFGVCMRSGLTKMTGATVCHIHAHLIVPEKDPKTGRAKTVNFPVG